MRITVLGVPSVDDGSPDTTAGQPPGRRAQLLLCALALEPGPLPAERLADLIWNGAPPPTWRVALRGLVAALRASVADLEGDLVDTTPTGYRPAAGVTTDVDAMRAAITESERLLALGRAQQVVELLDSTAGVTGTQLASGIDAQWIDQHRVQVDDLAVRASELLAEAASSLGEHPRAVTVARRAAAAHPLNELAHRCLIRALDLAGDRAGVVVAYETCRALLADQLGVDPSAETVAAYLSALAAQPTDARSGVPRHETSFVGRGTELQRVTRTVGDPGLVTILGQGGVGKSRLAAEAVRARADSDTARVWVSLGTLTQDALVTGEVARALGVNPSSDDPAQTLVDHLAPLGRVILVLDGCEGVVDGVTALATALLAGTPQLTLVVTSRVPLQLPHEQRIPLEPLTHAVDPSLEGMVGNDSFRLLLDRVHEQEGLLGLDVVSAPAIADLLGRCAGVPLALELVAAQLTAMAPGDLVDHLDEVSEPGTEAVRAMAEATCALLDDHEAHVFRWLGVVEGAATLATIRHVVASDALASTRVIRVLRELTARGLVAVDTSGPRWTYTQDDELHRLAREQLRAEGEDSAALERVASLIEGLLPDDPRRPPAPYAEAVSELMPSLRGLFTASLTDGRETSRSLGVAFRLHRYWAATNVAEGRYWLRRLVDASPGDPQLPHATYALGYLSYWAGDAETAVEELTFAASALFGVDDAYVARAQIYLGGLLDDLDRGPEAVEQVRRAIETAAGHGRDLQVAAAMGLGSVLSERGDRAAATYARAAIELCEEGGSTEQLAASLPIAAMCCWLVGEVEQARGFAERAFALLGDARRIARVQLLSVAGAIALADGDVASAIRHGRSADRDGTELGIDRELPLTRSLLALALLENGDLTEAARSAGDAVEAAGHLAYDFPSALALETCALVASAREPDAAAWAPLVEAAAGVRARGDRPVPAPLQRQLAPVLLTPVTVVEPDVAGARTTALRLVRPAAADDNVP